MDASSRDERARDVIDIGAGGGETLGGVGKNARREPPAPATARRERRIGKTTGRTRIEGWIWLCRRETRGLEAGSANFVSERSVE